MAVPMLARYRQMRDQGARRGAFPGSIDFGAPVTRSSSVREGGGQGIILSAYGRAAVPASAQRLDACN